MFSCFICWSISFFSLVNKMILCSLLFLLSTLFILIAHNGDIQQNIGSILHIVHSTLWCVSVSFFFGFLFFLITVLCFTFSSSHLCDEAGILRSAICTSAKTARKFHLLPVDQSEIIPLVPLLRRMACHAHSHTHTYTLRQIPNDFFFWSEQNN